MEFWDGPIDYTIDPKVLEKKASHKEKVENKEKYMFNIIDDIDSLENLPGKPIGNGAMEFSQTKHWNKTIDELEVEQVNQEKILSSLNNIEKILNKIYDLISNEEPPLPWWKRILK